MGISLAKGQKISLEKVATDAGITGGLSKIFCGLGWDTNQFDGGAAFDLDASAFLCAADGKVASDGNFVFYNNLKSNGVEHMGDNLTGIGDGDDEVIKIDLNSIPADIDKVSIAVTINKADERKQNFGMVCGSYIRVVDEATNTELLRYDLGEDYSVETAVVVAEIYRSNGVWKFNAVGSGFAGGLGALVNNFGLQAG